MINKKIILMLMLVIFLIGLVNVQKVNAVGEVSFCCEKTKAGAYCLNAPENECDTSIDPVTKNAYRKVPTNCEATNYCKLGTCINSRQGICMENTPLRICDNTKGLWKPEEPEEIPQCALGCCLIGDQAAFVTQTRCKTLSSQYGLEINFRADITDEAECIAAASSSVKGACVFDKEFERTCKILSQKECKKLEGSVENVEFHDGFLCTAEELATNCAPTKKTTCIEGGDEVFFLDSCGNLANIYDSTKYENDRPDREYWTRIKDKGESCNPNSPNGNAGSASCGNCDYLLGSVCKKYDRTEDITNPKLGNNICRDLSCNYEGNRYEHGETWCATNGVENVPGSESFRLVCYANEVTIEPCAAFRGERCIQDNERGFSFAACRVNRWRDCIAQTTEKNCLNEDKRDCQWINSGNLRADLNEEKTKELAEKLSDAAKDGDIYEPSQYYQFVCVPKYSPGYDFWQAESDAVDICSLGNAQGKVFYKADNVFDTPDQNLEDCDQGCYFISDKGVWSQDAFNWVAQKNNLCINLGDCGDKNNFLDVFGFNHGEDPVTCDGDPEACEWK